MQTLPPEMDLRKISLPEWAEIRRIQDELSKNKLNLTTMKQDEVGLAMEMLFRECRRLRSITDEQFLEGFNKGYDEGFQSGLEQTEYVKDT